MPALLACLEHTSGPVLELGSGCVPDYEEAPILHQDWQIVLLGHEPPPRRGVDALRLRDRCRLMIGHDSQHPRNGMLT